MQTRGGRLSADIQAVVAADFIRNLREETRKGFYGRLKQGLYPLNAPFGYRNNGGGKVKTIDPEDGQLVKKAFAAFVARDLTLQELSNHLGSVSPVSLSRILRNPFYSGRIQLKNGERFDGKHEPLISEALFSEVQRVLAAKRRRSVTRHTFAFSRIISCECGYSMIAEMQKGNIYYRCHTPTCPAASVREDRLHALIREQFLRQPNGDLICLAYAKASARQKRMLLSHFRVQIAVRGLVRGTSWVPQIAVKSETRGSAAELGRILQEILSF